MSLKLRTDFLSGFVSDHEVAYMQPAAKVAYDLLKTGVGPGNDFHGWVDLPENYDKEEFARIKVAAEKIKKNSDILVLAAVERLEGDILNTARHIINILNEDQ